MAYSEVILADNPVGYWKLNETSGTTAADSSTNSNNGTISGTPTMGANGLVFEPSGKCIDFDGSNDEIDLGTSFESVIDNATQLSIEIWFSSTNNSATNQFIITFSQDTAASGIAVALESGKVRFRARPVATDALEDTYTVSSSFADGNAHHLVCVCDFVKRTWGIYVDGVSQEIDQEAPTSWTTQFYDLVNPDPGQNSRIGTNISASSSWFTGNMQHAAVYTSQLTPLQVRKHYQAGIAQGFHKEVLALNPTAYFPLNEASGDAIDWSGNDNNGVHTGTVTQGSSGVLGYDNSTACTFTQPTTNKFDVDLSSIASSTTFSLCMWVNQTTVDSGYAALIGRSPADNRFYLKNGQLNYWSGSDNLFDTTLVAGETNFIVFSVNAGVATCYVDAVADVTTVSGVLNQYVAGTWIGGFTANTQNLDGLLQGVAFFPTALTAAQIRTLYQSGKTLIESRGYPKVIQNLNPTGYWRLGEASGTTAFDESGNDNDGTINGSPVMATADAPLHLSSLKAMTFDGVDDVVQTNYAGQTGSTARTLLALVKASSLASVNPVASYGTNTAADMFQLTVDTDGKIKLDINGADAKGSTVLSVDTYYLIGAVLTGTDVNSINLYVNGVAETEVYTSGATVLTTASSVNLRIGQDIAGSAFFSGDIAEVCEVASAMTAQQMRQVYEAVKSRYAAEIISYQPTGYWRGNEASGTTLIDYGSEGNDGTLVNATFGNVESPLTNETTTSIDFDGSGDYVTIPHVANYNQNEQTILFASLPPAVQPSDDLKGLVWKSVDTGTTRNFHSGYSGAVGVGLRLGGSTGSTIYNLDVTDDSIYGSGVWGISALVKSLNGANDDLKGYYNGELLEQITTTDGHLVQLTNPIEFGRVSSASTAARYLDGQMAEVSVFPTALTSPQILDIYEMASYVPESVTLTYKVKGTLTEGLAITDWIARVYEWDTGAYLTQVLMDTSVSSTYSADVEPFDKPCLVTITPNMGVVWSPSTSVSVGDYIYPTDPETNPRYFIVTTAGTTGTSEPTWPTSGTVNDNGVVFTFHSSMVRPASHGPVVPKLLA